MAALADDLGLVVDALDGRPGVLGALCGHAWRLPRTTPRCSPNLRVCPTSSARGASVCSRIHQRGGRRNDLVEGTVEGRIGHELRGSEGFGYDPMFMPEEFGFERSLAEVSQDEKNAISHRGNALRILRAKLAE